MFKRKFYLHPTNNTKLILEYFDFNSVPYTKIDLFDNQSSTYRTPNWMLSLESSTLIFDCCVFLEILKADPLVVRLIEFLNHHKIVVASDMDAMNIADIISPYQLKLLDQNIKPGAITYIFDCKRTDNHWSYQFKNIKFESRPFSWFTKLDRLGYLGTEKNPNALPYMVTTHLKQDRRFRYHLYHQLKTKNLLDQGICVFRRVHDEGEKFPAESGPFAKRVEIVESTWVGLRPRHHNWLDGYASLDLYKNAWVEIAPETFYKGAYYLTEKTAKPIATKTPFLSVSTMGYLDYLREIGFKTFGHLISEDYDLQHRVNDRINLLIEQLEDIIKNGAESFYRASMDVLEHNQQRLAEITGSNTLVTDQFITKILLEIDQK